MKYFGLIGAAGYIAPRHMEAIKLNACELKAALDPNDSVGFIDNYFPNALFFKDFARFERYVNKQKSDPDKIDFLSICSPNYLHDTHCRFALNNDIDAISEKPLVLNPWNLDALQRTESETGRRIYNILQLRLHPAIIQLKNKVQNETSAERYRIDLNYITSRGPWYKISWKGDLEKSGGIASNIGIHLFDMLMWIFGRPVQSTLYEQNNEYAAGRLELANADVNWFLSVDHKHLEQLGFKNKRIHRSLKINDEAFDFSQGFENLHNLSYEMILNGSGFTTDDVRDSIELIHNIRNSRPQLAERGSHPVLRQINP